MTFHLRTFNGAAGDWTQNVLLLYEKSIYE